jgi:hypothetical protein
MATIFCKVEDSNKNKYILTDKFKQPLQCSEINKSCLINNFKQVINNPTIINNDLTADEFFFSLYRNTYIPCTIKKDFNGLAVDSDPIDKLKIDFNYYDIASVNKDIVIKNVHDIPITLKEIEEKFDTLYFMDKDKIEELNKISKEGQDYKDKGQEPPDEFKLNYIKILYNYKQKLLTKEDTLQKIGSIPEIFSSPYVNSYSANGGKYMKFTYDSITDTNKIGRTYYTITLSEDYEYMVDILIVGGGGGGGNKNGIIPPGGGSAGCIVYIVNKKLDAGIYHIIVGNGGARGQDGKDSMITTFGAILTNTVVFPNIDNIILYVAGGEKGYDSIITGGNGGNGWPSLSRKTFWDEEKKSYVETKFKGANGGTNYSGGGGGTLSEGKQTKGGDGRSINITGESVVYGIGGDGTFVSGGYNNGTNHHTPGSGGCGCIEDGNEKGNPGIVIINYRSKKLANPISNIISNPIPDLIPNPIPDLIPNPIPDLIPNPIPDPNSNPDPNIISNPNSNPDPNIISNIISNPIPNIISKPSENQNKNKNNMYIGIGVGIGVLLLMIAFFLYIRSNSNSNVTDTTSKSSTTRSRHFSSHK